jgi:uncharacterized protein with HEPN domain
MYDKQQIAEILCYIEQSLSLIIGQTKHIVSSDDFLATPSGVFTLDGVCMNLLAIGEAVKNIDKYTSMELLPCYPVIPWKDIMGMRDKIAHHYFDIDADAIFDILRNDIPSLLVVIKQMKEDIMK